MPTRADGRKFLSRSFWRGPALCCQSAESRKSGQSPVSTNTCAGFHPEPGFLRQDFKGLPAKFNGMPRPVIGRISFPAESSATHHALPSKVPAVNIGKFQQRQPSRTKQLTNLRHRFQRIRQIPRERAGERSHRTTCRPAVDRSGSPPLQPVFPPADEPTPPVGAIIPIPALGIPPFGPDKATVRFHNRLPLRWLAVLRWPGEREKLSFCACFWGYGHPNGS